MEHLVIFCKFQEKSSSDDVPGEASDVLSAISNEECSVNSEILDKQLDSLSQIHVADIIQVHSIRIIKENN